MTGERSSVLFAYRSDILSDLLEYEGILESLYQSEIIKERRYTQIKSKTDRFEAVSLLLKCVELSGDKGFHALCVALQEDYPWLSDKLLSASSKSDPNGTPKENSVRGLSDSTWLRSVPSEVELLALSKKISADDWESLAIELGMTLAELEKAKQPRSLVMKIYTMLVSWQRKEGDDGSRERICNAIKRCEMDHILQWWKPP